MKEQKRRSSRRQRYAELIAEAAVALALAIGIGSIATAAALWNERELQQLQVDKLATVEPVEEPGPVTVVWEITPEPVDEKPEAQAAVAPAFSEGELEALALVIYQEAGSDECSDETRMMVGTVVMNRVEDERFPDTIKGVLTEKAQYGRLHWTGLVWPERADDPGEAHAVARAYYCAGKILNGERALPVDVIWQAEFQQGQETVAFQDGMYFCR